MKSSPLSSIGINIRSRVFNFDCRLHRWITIIREDSGVGKSSMVCFLGMESIGVSVKCDLELLIANRTTWQLLFNAHDAVLVFDDLSCTETIEFATWYKIICLYLLFPGVVLTILNKLTKLLERETITDCLNSLIV